ncbi:MAG: ATP synthase subunit C [Candidatus Syntropharchaeia archaeon]
MKKLFIAAFVLVALGIVSGIASAQEEGKGPDSGMIAVGAGLAIGLAGFGAGIGVGTSGAAAVGATAEKPELFGRVLIFVALAEAIAIYGLLIAFMLFTEMG